MIELFLIWVQEPAIVSADCRLSFFIQPGGYKKFHFLSCIISQMKDQPLTPEQREIVKLLKKWKSSLAIAILDQQRLKEQIQSKKQKGKKVEDQHQATNKKRK